jgi:DNA processing protein
VQTCSPQDLLGLLNDVERKNAPEQLFAAGRIEVFDAGRRVSVVGTRKPSPEGIARARALVRALVGRRMVVFSGLAAGIDTIAHSAAIEERGHTVAVLGTSLDDCYPPENRSLQEQLMRDHLVISQFTPGTPSQRTNFPRRNRTMALLTDATVIVEAGESSGTLHQGWEALRLGRPLFLMESLTKDASLHWPAEMIRYGAQVLSRANLEAVLDAIPERTRGELAF